MYQLKKGKPGFEVVDGKFAGRSYVPGISYSEIPPEEAAKFEEVASAQLDPTEEKASKKK